VQVEGEREEETSYAQLNGPRFDEHRSYACLATACTALSSDIQRTCSYLCCANILKDNKANCLSSDMVNMRCMQLETYHSTLGIVGAACHASRTDVGPQL
jgi:hypothetical protein